MFNDTEVRSFNPSPHSPHTKVINYIPAGAKVLDVGCSQGYIDEKLKEKGCQITGIEINETLANLAKKYCEKVVVGDVETMQNIQLPEKYFDFIIYMDILEHLKRPDSVLRNFKKYLNPRGLVIASIPNAARLEYRIKHFLGNFDYEESGIFSKTHLRFFTLKTAVELFRSEGYHVVEVNYTGLGSRLKIFPTLFAFQFILISKPTGL